MTDMLKLCTKNVHFNFQSKTYVQTDGVAMGSSLESTLVNIFLIELENLVLPNLTKYIIFWK